MKDRIQSEVDRQANTRKNQVCSSCGQMNILTHRRVHPVQIGVAT